MAEFDHRLAELAGVELTPPYKRIFSDYRWQVRLLIEGGKLFKADGWDNVAKHCLIQVRAAEALADLIGLRHEEKIVLAKVAACHDWKKRLERKPDQFTAEEKSHAEHVLLPFAAPDEILMGALTPWFLPRVLAGEATFLQLVQFYVDDIARGEEIVLFDERIDEVSKRNPDPEPEVAKILGRPYWDVEREVGHRAEKMLFAILLARSVPIDEPENIPRLIVEQMQK